MEKKYNFVYVTTNLLNGKKYIGDHSTNDMNCWKTIHYLGSGSILGRSFKKNGSKNFIRKDLEFFPTKKEAFDAQEKYIKEYNTLNPNGYNISPKGGLGVQECFSEETLTKLSNSLKGRTSPNKGKKLSEEHKANISKNHNKFLSEKTKEQISKSLKGKCKGKILSEETKLNISIGKTGKKFTQKQIDARKNIKKTKCPYCDVECIPQLYSRWHGDNCKNKNI